MNSPDGKPGLKYDGLPMTTALPTTTLPPASSADERVKILLVDDEPRNVAVLETILDDPTYDLVRAESGEQALLALMNAEIAVIVLDIHMPGMSGFEVAQMIKSRPRTASIPIIFLTAHYSEDRHVLEGYETGAVDYLHKPVTALILRSKVAVFAELHRKTRETATANRALLAEVAERRKVQDEMRALHEQLEQRVAERTAELLATNRALQQIQEELRESNRRKDLFLAMLGHELRNPLAPICNAVAILQGHDVDTASRRWCHDVIQRQAEHLTRLVDDLLDVSRVSRGMIHLEKRDIDLATAVQQGIEICRPLIDARRHELTLTVPTAPVLVEGDATRLAQVVANLVNNAAKYTDVGGRLSVMLEVDPNSPQPAVIRVRDNGRGLDAEALASMFELFYQVNTTLDRSDGGLGVGLALVRSLVGLHGGTVEAYSPGPGSGSEFIVRLPGAPARQPAPEPSAPVHENSIVVGLRILVVDDNCDAARSMAKMLQILGHSTSMAHEGRSAIDLALRERPDVVFLDIGLPGLNGYEVCQALREQGLKRELLVAITGYGQEDDRQRAMEAGFDLHLVKPVRLAAVKELLAGQVAKR
jgi:signal transduction histidine kinase